RPSGKTAAQARKQRWFAISGSVIAVLAIAYGVTYFQGHNFLPESTPGWLSRPGPQITATGDFGKAPKVSIPKDLVPSGKLEVDAPIKGDGRKIANGDTVVLKFAFHQWAKSTDEEKPNESTSKELNSTWKQPAGQQTGQFVVGKTQLTGLDKGLVGQTAGSRLIIEIPPGDGFGKGQ
ncbi:hypothetical protein ACFQ07_05460, partial [Actinomadura adrarensis]